MYINWKYESDEKFWIVDSSDNRVMGPLRNEAAADHALKTLTEGFDAVVCKYKYEFVDNFSPVFLLQKATAAVIESFLDFKSIIISPHDAEKIVNLLGINLMSHVDIIETDKKELWINIKILLETLPSTNFQDVIGKADL